MFETQTDQEYRSRRRGRRSRQFDDREAGPGYAEELYQGEDEYADEYSGLGELESPYYGEMEDAGELEDVGEFEALDEYELDEAEFEEQFLPLIPIAGKLLGSVLPSLLGGLLGGKRELETEYDEAEYDEAEYDEVGEAEEQFLGRLLKTVLGGEMEVGEALSPTQESELVAELLEITDEQELEYFLGKIVNLVGQAVQGVSNAARSPQGMALIEAVKPLARAALPALGGAVGGALVPGAGAAVGRTLGAAASRLFETETLGLPPEQEQYELARRLVRLTAGAAQDVAQAPQGTAPKLAADLAVIQESRRYARPVFGRALRRISPFARRVYGQRRGGYRGGSRSGRYGGRRPGWRTRYGSRRYGRGGYGRRYYPSRYGYGYGTPFPQFAPQEPEPEPMAEPPAPQPGFRWVAVPVGAGAPPPAGPPSGPGAIPPEPMSAPPAEPGPPAGQSEFGFGGYRAARGSWYRRGSSIVLHDA